MKSGHMTVVITWCEVIHSHGVATVPRGKGRREGEREGEGGKGEGREREGEREEGEREGGK